MAPRTLDGRVRKVKPSHNWTKYHKEKRPNGLNNPSNMCYRNSTLVALFHAPKFINALEQAHVNCRHATRKGSGNVCVACLLKRLSRAYWLSNTADQIRVVNTRVEQLQTLFNRIWPMGEMRGRLHQQQDSHDSYMGICDLLQRHMTRNGWPLFRSIMTTGQRTTTSCLACGYVSTSALIYHPSLTIGLPQGKGAERVLEHLVDDHFRVQRVDDYKCPGCGRRGNVEMTTTIHNPPDILCVQIARFIWEPHGRRKDNSVVDIDGHLDLTPHYVKGARERLDYELIASTLHSGSLTAGHYTCVARGPEERWASINDSHVSAATINNIIESHRLTPGFTPYLLFYRRHYP